LKNCTGSFSRNLFSFLILIANVRFTLLQLLQFDMNLDDFRTAKIVFFANALYLSLKTHLLVIELEYVSGNCAPLQ
jgi:hypothetical protein